ncbi:MAG: hypothetical protein SFV54_27695 [Bryobacteraceae bacterium]|nr:hypothetical protein [Bryobacteraceae bacterium]
MTRRRFAFLAMAAAPAAAAGDGETSVRGRLGAQDGRPVLRTAGGVVFLEGDKDTLGVLRDERLANADFEAVGQRSGKDRFVIQPIFKRAMYVHKDGKRLMVTYWCAVCAIRSYTPGVCWCCQEETALDLRESV